MSITLHRHGAGGVPVRPVRPVRSARPAWAAVVMAPIALVIAVLLALTAFHSVGEEDLTVWETVWFFVVEGVVLFTAPVVGIVMGVRAAASGNRSAAVAAGVLIAMLAALLVLLITGNWFDTTPSVVTGTST